MLKNYSKIKEYEDGTKCYINDEGESHRLDEPAMEHIDGSKFWCINGNLHRNIGPSHEWSNGGKRWMFKDKRHRIGGLDISLYDSWYIHGREYTKKQYCNKVWKI